MIQAGSSSYLLGHSQATTKAVEFRNPAPKVTCPLLLTEVSTKEGMPWLLWGVRFTGGEERKCLALTLLGLWACLYVPIT